MTPSFDKRISTGRITKASRFATKGRDRLRRLAMDALEPRTLMSVLPPPQIITRTNVSGTAGSQDTAPSISVDPLDPLRAVAVWSRAQNSTQPDIPAQYTSLGQGAYTTDGGQTWSLLTADTFSLPGDPLDGFQYSLPSPLKDPALGVPGPTTQYGYSTDLNVAFDRQHNLYVLESTHNKAFTSGALVLQKYDFRGSTPNLTISNKIVHQWLGSGANKAGDQAHTPTLAVDTGVGNPNTNQPDGSPAGIVTGPDGNIYVSVQDINQVQQIDGGSGLFTSTFASGLGLYQPTDIAYNAQDNALYISNQQSAQIIRVKADTGESLGVFTQGLVTPKAPREVVVSPIDGNLYVSSRDTSSILRYNAKSGAFLGSFVAPHSGGLAQPEGLAFGPDDRLYVADAKTNTILRYDGRTGVFIDIFVTVTNNGGLDGPRGLVFGPDKNIYVSSFNTAQVLRYDRNTGTSMGAFAVASTIDNDLKQPTSLAFSPIDGNLYVANYRGSRVVDAKTGAVASDEVLRYSGATGAFISSFLAPPTAGLSGPTGLQFRLNGPLGKDELLVGSFDTGEVYRFNARTGVFIDKFVADQSGALDGPTGFVFEDHGTTDPSDDTFNVTSGNTDVILRYRASDGVFLAAITPEPLNAPRATTLGPDGYLYAVSRDTDSVVRYDSATGKLLGTFVKSGSGGLNLPGGLTFGADITGDSYPDLFVGGNYYDNVLAYDGKTGDFVKVFLTTDPDTDRLDDPEGLTYKAGKLYVTSAKTGQVNQYDGITGAFLVNYTPEPLLSPEGTVVHNGMMYVASRDGDEVLQYDGTTGKFIKIFIARNSGGLDAPRGLTFRGNELFISSYNTDKVLRYDANGNFLGRFTPEPLRNPNGVATGPDGNLYVTSRDFAAKSGTTAARDLNEVLRYDGTTGAFIDAFVPADANGGLKNPLGLVFGRDLNADSYADLLVTSHDTNQILAYDGKTGAFLRSFFSSTDASDVNAVSGPGTIVKGPDGNIYIGNENTDEILRIDGLTGKRIGTSAVYVAANPQRLNGPEGMSFGPDGDLFVASSFTNSVVRYAGPSKAVPGQFVSVFVAAASGGLLTPTGIVFGADQDLYVSSSDTDAVLRYSGTTGAFLNSFIRPGTGGLDAPSGVIFGSDGNLFVVSKNTERVIRFEGAVGAALPNFVNPGANALTNAQGGVIGPDGNLYVVSAADSTIKRYNGSTTGFIDNFVTSGLGGLSAPTDLVFSSDGTNLFVTGAGGQIYRYNAVTGAFISVFVNLPTSNFRGLAFQRPGGFPNGILYAVDITAGTVRQFDGLTAAPLGTGGLFIAAGAGGLGTPGRISFGPDGNFYVTDGSSIRRYNGTTGAALPAPTKAGALFASIPEGPFGVAFGADGNLLVTANSNSKTLQLINGTTGNFIRTVASSTGGEVSANSQVPLFNRDGSLLVTGGTTGGVKRLVGGNGSYLGDFTPPTLDGPTGLSFGPDGNLYVASSLTDRIAKYSASGSYLGDVNPAVLKAPQDAIAYTDPVSGNKYLFATSRTTNEVIRYSAATGAFDKVFVTKGSGGLSQPKGLAFNPNLLPNNNVDGNLYVASQGTGQILRYDGQTGAFLGVAVDNNTGTLPSSFDGITFGADGNADGFLDLYATDAGNNRVIRVDGRTQVGLPAPTLVGNNFTPVIASPSGLTFGPDGKLYVANALAAGTISRVDQVTGAILNVFVAANSGGLQTPQRLTFFGDGFLYVSDVTGNQVLRYRDTDGKYLDTTPFIPNGLGGLNGAIGLALVPGTGVLVVSSGTNAILQYSFAGGYIAPFTARTLSQPEDLAFLPSSLDIDQKLLVTSYGTDEVLRYTYNGNGGQFDGIFVSSGLGGLSGPQALTVGPDGLLYVSSSKNNSVLRYRGASDPFGTFNAGDFFDTFVSDSSGGLSTPQGLAFAADGSLLVASRKRDVPPETPLDPIQAAAAITDVVLRFGPNGVALGSFTPEPLKNPVGLAFNNTPGGDGALYVTSRDGDKVLRFVGDGAKGDFLGVFTSADLHAPTGATLGPDNNLYVASRNTNEILRYDGATGSFLDVFVIRGAGGLVRPEAIAFSPRDNNLYVASKGSRPGPTPGTLTYFVNIIRYKGSNGDSLGSFATFDLGTLAVGAAPVLAYNPVGIAFDTDGNLYVSNFNANTVLRFRAVSGAAFPAAGQAGAVFVPTTIVGSSTALAQPVGLTFDINGDLFVANSGSNQVLRYAKTTGLPKPSSPNPGTSVFAATGTSGLTSPQFLAFDSDGSLYVTSALGTPDPTDTTPAPFQRKVWTRNEVIRFNGGTGAFIDKFVTDSRGGLSEPSGLVFGRDLNGDGIEELLVSSQNTDQVLAYDGKTGNLLSYDGSKPGFAAKFSGAFSPGPLRKPEAVAFGPNGDLFVSSGGTNSVLRYQGGTGKLQANYVAAGSGDLRGPSGLVFAADGSLLVASRDSDDILRYQVSTGILAGSLEPDRPIKPTFSAINPLDGFLYVSSTETNSIVRYDPATGKLLGTFVAPGAGLLSQPQGLAFGTDGNLYVASRDPNLDASGKPIPGSFKANDKIVRYNGRTGQFIDTFVPSNPGLLLGALGIVFGPDFSSGSVGAAGAGDLYVASFGNDKVLRFNRATGNYLGDYVAGGSGGLDGPSSIAFDSAGFLYVGGTLGTVVNPPGTPPVNNKPDSILRYRPITGNFDKVFVEPGTGGLDGPTAIVFGPNGDLFVASDALRNSLVQPQEALSSNSSQDNRVLRFQAGTGAYLGAFVARGLGDLDGPSGLSFDGSGNLYVTSRDNGLVIKYDSTGKFVTRLDATPALQGVAIGADVNGDGILEVYATAKDRDAVFIYDGHTGEYVRTLVQPREGGLSVPTDLIFSGDGLTLYVSSSANNKVNAYDAKTGAFIRSYSGGGLLGPDGMIIRGGLLYVAGTASNSVVVFNLTTGAVSQVLTGANLQQPKGVAFDQGGNLLVTSYGTKAVLRHVNGAFSNFDHAANAAFTDPATNKSQNDEFSNNVYIAWATNVLADTTVFTSENQNAIVLVSSSDGAKSFSPPQVMNDTRFLSTTELDGSPRLTISQGRPAGTLNPTDPGVPAGQVTVVWDDFGTNNYGRTGQPEISDRVVTDRVQAGVSYSTTADYQFGDPTAFFPASTTGPLTTQFKLPVNISDPRFTTLSHVDLRLSLVHGDLSTLSLTLLAPDGTRVPLASGLTGTGFGLQPTDKTVSDGDFNVDTIFDDQAPRAITNTLYTTPFVGRFRPATPNVNLDGKSVPGPGFSALTGMDRTKANGVWILEVTDNSGKGADAVPPTFKQQRILNWGLDLSSNLTDSKDVVAVAAAYPVGRLERYAIAGIPQAGPLLLSNSSPAPALPGDPYFGGDPAGIFVAPVLASDNTLGSFSPYQGRIYLAYVDGYVNANFIGNQPGDNTNIYLKYSDDGGQTWTTQPRMVNDDDARTDGFSEADISGPAGSVVDNGRPQFSPSIAVDPSTGTLALSFYDTRYDPQHARTAMFVATSIDGGTSFAPQTFMNSPQAVTDGITGQTVILGPIPDNMSKSNGEAAPGTQNGVPTILDNKAAGYGQSQGLAFVGGRLYPAWASNENRGPSGTDQLDIRIVAATLASGPRVVSSSMGALAAQTVTDINGNLITFNDKRAGDTLPSVSGVADGTPMVDGFVLEFDRPVDPASLNPTVPPTPPIVTVTFRDEKTAGTAPGVSVPVNPVITPLQSGSTVRAGVTYVTKFLVRFAPQGGTGTYSYQVGAAIRDLVRTVTADGTIITGNLMDQDGNAIGGQDPRISPVTGFLPGDVYSVPRPSPLTPTTYSGPIFSAPYDRTTQPILVPGPSILSTFVPGSVKTPDNLVLDSKVAQIAVVFDRDMDPTTLTSAAVLRVFGPQGLINGPFTVTPQAGQGIHLRTFLIGFPEQQLNGTYAVTLASTVASIIGERLDTNKNAGLDVLRGDPSGGTEIVTFNSNDAKAPAIGGSTAGRVTTSKITVPEQFTVQNVTLTIDLTYPFDPDLDGALIAPDGTRVQLFSGVGQTGDNKNFSSTTFDDRASTPIQNGGPPFFGTFNPRFPLAAFIGHSSRLPGGSGDWTLEITDNAAGRTGTINKWTLNLTKPIPATGLGDAVADQATVSFRIFTQDPASSLSSNTWTAVGPAGIGAKGQGLNAEISGRVTSTVVDPSDPSGNTVYVSAAGGGIWKTRNFLTTDPSGPTYIPLTDFGPSFGLNIGNIAVFPRNNDPSQSILFATTGDPDQLSVQTNFPTASPTPTRGDSQGLTSRGVGFLRSMDGGATWVLLDSTTNFDSTGGLLALNSPNRDHVFVGTAGFKIVVDPKATPTGDVIVYAALSDVDANGNALDGTGRAGGLWRSVDTGKTWIKLKAGQATDVVLDLNSGTGATGGNLQILYAAFRGDGIYRSPNRGQEFDLMTGTIGNPLIQDFDGVPTQPVGVLAPQPGTIVGSTTPNGIKGRIALARPSLTGKPLEDVLYQGWLYAAVISSKSLVTTDNQLVQGGYLEGLYLTKDFGQNWTRVQLPAFSGGDGTTLPSTDDRLGEYDPFGLYTPGLPLTFLPVPPRNNFNYGTGNFNLSLAVDPTNPNVVYLGGSSQFQDVGLMRIDTTGVADPHAFYMSQTDVEGGKVKTIANYGPGGERSIMTGWNPILSQVTEIHGPVVQSNPGAPYAAGPNAPFNPAYTPYLNLIANPRNPFLTASTIPVTNTLGFLNSGAKAKWTALDQALKPDTFNTDPNDPWSVPARGVHSIVPLVDPVTGKTRLIFGTDNGIFTAVDGGDGTLIGSLGSVQKLDNALGDVKIATGSRNGNLQTAELTNGAAQPSLAAAVNSLLKGYFYASTQFGGSPYSNANVITPGQVGYGDLTWDRPFVERTSGSDVGVVQTNSTYADFGSFYRYILPSEMDNLTGAQPSVVTDFLQRDLTSRTFNLLQSTSGQIDPFVTRPIPDVPDPQWPFRKGYNFAINPLSGEQLLISSEEGRIFSTENQGKFWNVIGNPSALDSSNAQALAYGAPDVANANLGNLNSFIYAGTVRGNIFVTFEGGGTNGNQWTNLSAGLDGSAIQKIITNPTRTSHEAYAVTRVGVYHMADSKAVNATWVNITGNLFDLTTKLFNDPNQVDKRLKNLTSIQADWRYIIPDNFAAPNGPSHPMLYVGGEGGVFRSIDNGGTWNFFPTIDPNGVDATPLSAGDGGGLPNAVITDLDIVLGEIDPTNGRPNISTGPNTLYATTYGRGAFTIRLAPIVFPNSKANPSVLHLSQTLPSPGGSDTGLSTTDQVTNLTQPYIEGLSEQSAFGSVVTISLFDMTDGSTAPVFIGSGQTDAAGKFSVQVGAGIYTPGGVLDASLAGFVQTRNIGIQATDQSGTKGNLTQFSFTLDVKAPNQPNVPTLDPASDSGRLNNDRITSVTNPFIVVTGTEATARVFLFRDNGTKAVATRTGDGKVQDPGPLTDGTHTYYIVQEDVAGNFSPSSDLPPGSLLTIVVDTTIPVPTLGNFAPDLQDSSDSGSSNTDNITNKNRPVFNVFTTPLETTSSVNLFRKLSGQPDSAYVLVGTSIGSGAITDNGTLADGTYLYMTRQVDLAGNIGGIGDTLSVTIDTQGNGPPTVPDLQDASDTGTSNTDNYTSATKPVFDVTSNDSKATVQLLRKLASEPVGSYVVVATAFAFPGLLVSITDPGPLADGTYSYAALQIDLAGNPGTRSNPLTVVIDHAVAINPLSLVLDSKSDSGASKIDQVTNVAAPFFDVTTGESNQKIQLYRKKKGDSDTTYIAVGGVLTQTIQGVGILQDPAAPANGIFVYSVQATDLAGNPGPIGVVTTEVTFDNIAPDTTTAPDLRPETDTGVSTTDNITNSKAPAFDIPSTVAKPLEPNATIQLLRKLKTDGLGGYVIVGTTTVGAVAGTVQVIDGKSPADALYTYATRQIDLAGNIGNISDPDPGVLEVRIDTAAPLTPTLSLDPRDDTGTAGDGITSVIRPRLIGRTEAFAFVTLTGDATASGQAGLDGTYTLVPDVDLSIDKTYLLRVVSTDVAGNQSTSAQLALTIDTTAPGTPVAPDLDAASDSGQFSTDNVTNVKTPIIVLTASESGATVLLFRKKSSDPDSSYVLVGQVVNGGPIQDTAAANLADGTYSYAAKQIDASGNLGSFGGALTVVFDTVKPAVAPQPQLDPSSDSNIKGDGITNVKVGRIFNVVATEPTATVQLFRKLQGSLDSTYTLVSQVVGSGAITDSSSLPDTTYVYAAGQVDLAGNVGALGTSISIAIDTRPPNSPTLNLSSADNTGSKSDSVTSVKRPRFTGVTEAGSVVELLSSGDVIARTTADPVTGTYTLQPTTDLFDGGYTIQARASDVAGNAATSLSSISLVIDTVPPAVPTIGLFTADDTGAVGDNVTDVRRPRIVGTTDAKATVVLLDDKLVVRATTVADSKGAYTLQPALDLDLGKYTFQTRAADQADNQSLSSTLMVTIVASAPVNPTMILVAADDSGTAGDNVTNVNRPRFTGGSSPAATVDLMDSLGNFYGTTTADATGAYIVRPSVALVDGAYAFSVRVRSTLGITTFSNTLGVTIDTTAPTPPILTMFATDDTGVRGDFVTSNRRPRLVGKSEPNGVAALYGPTGTLLSAVVTASDGTFTLQTISNLNLGKNNLTVRTSDLAGNLSGVGAVSTITVIKATGDYDGDGRSDFAVYDSTTATFFILYSNGGSKVFTYGVPNGRGLPVAGDFDGDGKTDISVYDPTSATFFVTYSAGGGNSFPFGIRNHNNIPDPGDFDGDGRTDLAVYDPVDAKFYIFYSTSGLLTQPVLGEKNVGGLPVPGDYDGDGKTDVVVYNPKSSTFSAVYANGKGGFVKQFGVPNAGDLPIPADFDGDGKTDLAVYDPGPAFFYQLYSNPLFNGGSKIYQYGVPNGRGIPVYADYDGDGKTDTTAFDPSEAKFYATLSAGGAKIPQFGDARNRNVPIPSVVPPPSSISAASLVGGSAGGSVDFTPIVPSTPIASRSVMGFAFGHPDRPVKVKVQPKKVRARYVHAAKNVVKVAKLKATPHDLALESLWDNGRGE